MFISTVDRQQSQPDHQKTLIKCFNFTLRSLIGLGTLHVFMGYGVGLGWHFTPSETAYAFVIHASNLCFSWSKTIYICTTIYVDTVTR